MAMASDPVPVAGGDAAGDSYARRTVDNVAWLGSAQLLRQVAAMVTTVVLARFLSPEDYGIFAMTLFINELAQLFVNFGVGSALVQRKQVDQLVLSTCFWINLLIAAVVGVVVLVASPFVAGYYRQPTVADLLWVSAVNICVGALIVIPQTLLTRLLNFRDIALGGTLGSLGGAAGTVALAASGAGVWSLVAQPVIGTTLNLLYVGWRARWWPSLRFNLASVRGVLGFSANVMVESLVGHVARNLQQILVAPVIGAAAMGVLAMATMAAWMPVAQFTQAAVRAIYPVFARLQDEQGRFAAGLSRAVALIALLTFPLLVGLAVLAPEVMPLVFGAQWASTVPLVTVLCGLCLLQSITGIAGSGLLAQGRAGTSMKLSLVSFVLIGVSLLLTRHHGIVWVTVALALSHGASSLLQMHLMLRQVVGGWAVVLRGIWRPLLAATGMGLAVWLVRDHLADASLMARLLSGIGTGAVAYIALTLLINRPGWLELWQLVQRRRG